MGAFLPPLTFRVVHANNTLKVYYVNVVVDIKPIYLNKRYLFQRKIYYLDKFYFCFAKIKLSKHTLYKLNWIPD